MSDNTTIASTRQWYEESYTNLSINAQRQYPNEELVRFLGRNFLKYPTSQRLQTKILEVGCGSCGNLWAIAKEGFDAYGIDLSSKAIECGKQLLTRWNTTANLEAGSMTAMPYSPHTFDAVCDIFSSYCLTLLEFENFLEQLRNILKVNGKYFLYTPSDNSDAFKNHAPAKLIDTQTLNGIYRPSSPFYGNLYPFRFENVDGLTKKLSQYGFAINYCEKTSRTYHLGKEVFEFITLEATKI